MYNFLVRLFVAIELPDAVRRALSNAAQALRQHSPTGDKVNWVHPEAYHLTLKFLGECDPARTAALKSSLRLVSEKSGAFTIALNRLGCFPERGAPRVIWAGASEAPAACSALAAGVAQACETLGFAAEDHPFHAHATLARVKWTADSRKLRALVHETPLPALGPISVGGFSLMQSHLTGAGAQYSRVEFFALSKP